MNRLHSQQTPDTKAVFFQAGQLPHGIAPYLSNIAGYTNYHPGIVTNRPYGLGDAERKATTNIRVDQRVQADAIMRSLFGKAMIATNLPKLDLDVHILHGIDAKDDAHTVGVAKFLARATRLFEWDVRPEPGALGTANLMIPQGKLHGDLAAAEVTFYNTYAKGEFERVHPIDDAPLNRYGAIVEMERSVVYSPPRQ